LSFTSSYGAPDFSMRGPTPHTKAEIVDRGEEHALLRELLKLMQ